MSYLSVEPQAEWLGSRRFWLACIAILVLAAGLLGARSAQLMSRTANPVEVHLYGQAQLVPGQSASFRVLVNDGKNAQAIAGAPVDVVLIDEKGGRIELGSGSTDASGGLVIKQTLRADLPEGTYRLEATTSLPQGAAQASHGIVIKRGYRIMLTTDKPLYQPGQTIHLRALAIDATDGRPAAARELLFEVQDGKGNKVFKQKVATSQYGIAATDFVLADQVNMGDYGLSVSFGGASARRQVTVKTYVLPKYRVDVTTDRPSYQPGDTLHGEVRATYTFGQPVNGARVRVVASEMVEKFHEFITVEGNTDATGRYSFIVAVPVSLVGQPITRGNALIKLDATVTPAAGGEQQKSLELVVAKEPMRIEVVSESGELQRGLPNRVYLVVSSVEGEPLLAQLTVRGMSGNNPPRELTTSRLGVAQLEVTPDATSQELTLEISATGPSGQRVEVTRKLPVGVRVDGVLLRPEHAVYRTGGSVKLDVLATTPTGRAFIDVVKDQRTVMMHAIDVKEGRGTLTFDLPQDLTGTLELSAYILRKDGEIVRDVRLIQVHAKDGLQVSLHPEKPSYAPGGNAIVDVSVTRPDGTGVAAALGLVGVDEAVFALYDTRPGLEQLYFTLQEELLKPRYEVHAHLPPPVIGESQGPEVDEAQTVLLSAATERAATEAWPGLRYVDRQRANSEATQSWFRLLMTAAVMSPLGIYALLFLCAFIFAVSRLFVDSEIRWEDVPADEIDRVQAEQTELGRVAGRLMGGWVAGVLLPPLMAVVGQLIGELFRARWREREYWAIGGALLGILIITGVLIAGARAVRALPAAQGRTLWRRIVATVPWTYFFGSIGVLSSLAGVSHHLADNDAALFGCLVAVGLAVIYFGVLSVIRQTVLRRVGVLGWFWLFITRPLLFCLPGALLLLPMFMLSSKRAPAVFEERLALMPQAVMSPNADPMGGAKPPETGASSANLVQPTRVRRHFPETLLWRPEVITDASGKARIEIPLADSITTWRLAASAVTAAGELGGQTLGLRVFQDFFVDLEMPATLTQHDEVSVPVSVFNYLDAPQTVRIDLDVAQAKWLQVIGLRTSALQIGAKQTTTVTFRIRVLSPGKHTLTVRAAGSALADAVERTVTVLPDGQPVMQTLNGKLDAQVTQDVIIPDAAIEGGSDLYLKIYPGAFSQVVEGLDGIFQMPYGCFEQTSSTTYPSVLALDYLRRSKQTKPELELKALKYIGLGYQRLVSFEVSGGGFEWFGHAPAHNLLTAYGLLEFSDMSRVYEVDPALIERTRRWLWQQNHDGRFTPTAGGIAEGAINQYRNDPLRATAYITWALAEADKQKGGQIGSELGPSLDYIAKDDDDQDPYKLALRAQALIAAGRTGDARKLLEQLESQAVVDKAKDTAHFTSKAEGLTYSYGDSMTIETTALVAQALLSGGGHHEMAHRALRFLTSKRDPNGTWGSTQATIAAMRALLAGTEGGGVKSEIAVTLRANDAPLPPVRITPDTSDVYRLISLRPQVRKGKNSVVLTRTGEGDLAYQLVAVHHMPWTNSGVKKDEPMTIGVRYDATAVKRDALLGVHVNVRWNLPGAAQMTLVDLGIPPGFDLVSEDLEKLVETKVIERYSNTGRQLIVYLTAVAQDKPVTIDYRLRARYPVRAKTPASRAYPYYQPEAAAKADPVELVIK